MRGNRGLNTQHGIDGIGNRCDTRQDKTKGKWKRDQRWLEGRWLRPPNACRTPAERPPNACRTPAKQEEGPTSAEIVTVRVLHSTRIWYNNMIHPLQSSITSSCPSAGILSPEFCHLKQTKESHTNYRNIITSPPIMVSLTWKVGAHSSNSISTMLTFSSNYSVMFCRCHRSELVTKAGWTQPGHFQGESPK
jgi:hypothetical protein